MAVRASGHVAPGHDEQHGAVVHEHGRLFGLDAYPLGRVQVGLHVSGELLGRLASCARMSTTECGTALMSASAAMASTPSGIAGEGKVFEVVLRQRRGLSVRQVGDVLRDGGEDVLQRHCVARLRVRLGGGACAGGKAENKQDGKEQCGQFFHVHDFLSKMEYGY